MGDTECDDSCNNGQCLNDGGDCDAACDNLGFINAACPVHGTGEIVPASCDDDPNTAADDNCAAVFTGWYSTCWDSTAVAGIRRALSATQARQLTNFNQMCITAAGSNGH